MLAVPHLDGQNSPTKVHPSPVAPGARCGLWTFGSLEKLTLPNTVICPGLRGCGDRSQPWLGHQMVLEGCGVTVSVLDIRLLGTVEAWSGGRVLDLGPRQRRHVLAAIAADAGQPVSVDVVVERVWGGHAPARARRSVHAHITRIRRVFEEAVNDGHLRHSSLGYILDLDPLTVDLHRYQQLTGQGRTGEALRLWRGEPLSGLDGNWADRFRVTWVRRRLDTVREWAEAEMAAGTAGRTTALLSELVAEHPLHEGLRNSLIRALDASGRSAEAIAAYGQARRHLVAELGIEPGEQLQATYRSLLATEVQSRPAPAQLPSAVRHFTGRKHELERLETILADRRAMPIVVLSGPAGVGKTALATTWAHRIRDRFPDGHLYADLHGPNQPMDPLGVLAGFLTALGVPLRDLPLDLDQRAALFRTQLARLSMLIVLDNASSSDQIRPLLPGLSGCAVVVTSRDTLAGLVTVDGAQRIMLDQLPAEDAYALLRRLIGPAVDSEAEAARALAELCMRMPLALRIAAELVLSRPATTLTTFVTQLQDRPERLYRLDAGGEPRSTVSALTGHGSATVRHHLDLLARAHLITPGRLNRYTMHDLLRAYAFGLAENDKSLALDRLASIA